MVFFQTLCQRPAGAFFFPPHSDVRGDVLKKLSTISIGVYGSSTF